MSLIKKLEKENLNDCRKIVEIAARYDFDITTTEAAGIWAAYSAGQSATWLRFDEDWVEEYLDWYLAFFHLVAEFGFRPALEGKDD